MHIDRASYASAVKVKDNAVWDIYDKKGHIIDLEANFDSSLVSIHNREYDGLQAIIPHSKSQILSITQVNRGYVSSYLILV